MSVERAFVWDEAVRRPLITGLCSTHALAQSVVQ
jgi:hypothetical protein